MRVSWILLFTLVGCSASERIAVEANGIGDRANTIHRLALRIGEQSDQPEVVADAATIATESMQIRHGVANVHAALPGVTDKVPAWLSTLQWWGIAVAVLAVAFVLWQSGAFTAIRIAVGWLPRRKVAQAELALDTLDQSRPEGDRELVAALRSDPEFDAAFRKARKRRKAQE